MIKSILLIDDDDATNFLHRIEIEDHGCCENIVSQDNGQRALEYLSTKENGKYPCPEVIFVDINMPLMDGWEFLEAYEKLPEDQRGEVAIIMLSTSLNPYDEARAKQINTLTAFNSKPLNKEILDDIIAKYFIDKK